MMRPLCERMNDWTEFERLLFNAFTQHAAGVNRLLFSQRLRVVQAMLDSMEAETAVIQAERDSQL